MSNSSKISVLMQSIQCVATMSRFVEEYLLSPACDSSEEERGNLGEFIMDLDTTLDVLSTEYEALRKDGDGRPDAEALQSAFLPFTMSRKAGR